MAGWKEKVHKVIQRIRNNRLVQWFHDKDISTQYRILFVILASVIIIWNIINIYFNSFKIDDVSARYLLSALVQSLAAIIAIVVTLTLVAVQLTASAYSPRVIDVFKKDWVMWTLLVWHGLSIFSGLFVLEIIGGTYSNSWCIIVPLETLVLFVYLMGISAFAGLFWHIGNMIDLLKPENIIKRLTVEITEDKILNPKKDPIQPIMDIIQVSIMKYDIATVECGLGAVMKNVEYIINISKYSDGEYISMRFYGRLGTAGRCALRAGEDESAMGVIGCLKDIATLAIEMHSDKSAKAAVQYIEMIGTVAAEKKLRFVACDAMASLKDVGTLAAKNQFRDLAVQAINSLGNVGMYAADNKIEIAAQDAAKYLGRVGMCAAENELGNAAEQAADSLGVVGNYAAENKLKYATSEATRSLGLVGGDAVKKELGDAAKQAVESLGLVGRISAENGLEDAARQTVPRLGLIGEAAAAKQGFDEVVEQAALHLGRIGRIAALNRFERVAEEAAKSLGLIGKVAVENELSKRSVPIRVIESLGRVGGVAAKQELNDATLEAATQLGIIGGVAAEKDLEFSAEQAIKCLIIVGKIAVESKKLEDAIHRVALHLISIGSVAIEKEFKFAARIAAEYLAELTISNEEIVENEIKFGGYPSEEKDRKFFDIFVNRYKQRLEELRTQK